MSDLSRLPSLNALRAFSATGEHLNMRAAASELNVTPSALSHQICGLEKQLGTKLFIRNRQGLTLTATGKGLHPQIAAAFSRLSEAVRAIRPVPHPGTLTASMLSTFALRWFIPRLHRFQQNYPDVEIRISTSIELVDFDQEDVDCAIRSGQGAWPGTHTLRLLDEQFTPVCSPSLLTGNSQLAHPVDLSCHTLLHSKRRPGDWEEWLCSERLENLQPRQNLQFETRNFAITAAVRGLGIAIIDPLLVQEELKDGRLIQPPFPKQFRHPAPTTWSGLQITGKVPT